MKYFLSMFVGLLFIGCNNISGHNSTIEGQEYKTDAIHESEWMYTVVGANNLDEYLKTKELKSASKEVLLYVSEDKPYVSFDGNGMFVSSYEFRTGLKDLEYQWYFELENGKGSLTIDKKNNTYTAVLIIGEIRQFLHMIDYESEIVKMLKKNK